MLLYFSCASPLLHLLSLPLDRLDLRYPATGCSSAGSPLATLVAPAPALPSQWESSRLYYEEMVRSTIVLAVADDVEPSGEIVDSFW